MNQQPFACLGQADVAGGARQERRPDPLLERANGLADRRRSDTQLSCSRPKPALFSNGDKHREPIKMSPLYTARIMRDLGDCGVPCERRLSAHPTIRWR